MPTEKRSKCVSILLAAFRNSSPGTPQMNGSVSPGSWHGQEEANPDHLRAAAVHGTMPVPSDDVLMRKPTRLDALPPASAKPKKKKKGYNTMDQI